MKNKLLYLLKSKIVLKVTGKNIPNFIKKVKVDLLNIKYKDNYILTTIYKSDYEKIFRVKTIYDIEIIEYKGIYRLYKDILSNYIILVATFISVFLIYIVSNLIFSIKVITNDNEMKDILVSELNNLGIKKYSFKKNFNKIQIIKSIIKEKHKDDIEWLEIENIGTKYIVRYEPRIKNNKIESKEYQNIVAKKDAIITKINVTDGEIVKSINTYVKKGEVIVQGKIYLNEDLKDIKSANGKIYGEVWYEVSIKYPLKYYENVETGKNHNMLSIVFLNKRFNINSKYKSSNIRDNILIKNNILPIYISFSKESETNIIDESNDTKEAIEKAINKCKDKINSNLSMGEYIKDYKILGKTETNEYVELDIFFTVIENITDYEKIVE